ncbi:MAG TPA: ribosome silencing factor [Actinomycetota bacterium]|nr:ribosome silencing factor [Actinomycetota bacterium]
MNPIDWVGRAVAAAGDKKARELVVLDVADVLGITDYFLIASGSSDRQVRTIAEAVEEKLKEDGLRPLRSEGTAESGWILIDYGDFIVHVLTEEMRAYYDLERLWKDAPRPELPELVEARQALGS